MRVILHTTMGELKSRLTPNAVLPLPVLDWSWMLTQFTTKVRKVRHCKICEVELPPTWTHRRCRDHYNELRREQNNRRSHNEHNA